jgi:hypothetical protein
VCALVAGGPLLPALDRLAPVVVVVGFHRVCVIDLVLPYSPVDWACLPPVPSNWPILGLGHLQFEALLTIAHLG